MTTRVGRGAPDQSPGVLPRPGLVEPTVGRLSLRLPLPINGGDYKKSAAYAALFCGLVRSAAG